MNEQTQQDKPVSLDDLLTLARCGIGGVKAVGTFLSFSQSMHTLVQQAGTAAQQLRAVGDGIMAMAKGEDNVSGPSKWTEMTPDQRDMLVAEKVMGWKPVECNIDTTDAELTIYDDGEAWCPVCKKREHINSFDHGIIPPLPYSRSMGAAWKLVAHYAVRTIVLEQQFYKTSDRYGENVWLWACTLVDVRGSSMHPGKEFRGLAKQPPEAICLAFLKACDVEAGL